MPYWATAVKVKSPQLGGKCKSSQVKSKIYSKGREAKSGDSKYGATPEAVRDGGSTPRRLQDCSEQIQEFYSNDCNCGVIKLQNLNVKTRVSYSTSN